MLFTSSNLETKQKIIRAFRERRLCSKHIHLYKKKKKENSPKLSDKFSKDVPEFGSEVPSHIIRDVSNALHLNITRVLGIYYQNVFKSFNF